MAPATPVIRKPSISKRDLNHATPSLRRYGPIGPVAFTDPTTYTYTRFSRKRSENLPRLPREHAHRVRNSYSILVRRTKSLRGGQMQLVRAMRHQSSRNRQLRVRARVRSGHEAHLCPRWHHLHVHVRAEEAGLPDEEQHRSGLCRYVRLQGTLLGEGESRLNHAECLTQWGMHARNAITAYVPHETCPRFPLSLATGAAAAAVRSEFRDRELLHFGECLGSCDGCQATFWQRPAAYLVKFDKSITCVRNVY